MEITDKVGQAKPEPGNATGFNRWLFTDPLELESKENINNEAWKFTKNERRTDYLNNNQCSHRAEWLRENINSQG